MAVIDKEIAWLRAQEGFVKGYLPLQWGAGACPANCRPKDRPTFLDDK